jgi:hypothetical protein
MVKDAYVKGRVEKVLKVLEGGLGGVLEYEICMRRPVYGRGGEGFAVAVLVIGSGGGMDRRMHGMKFGADGRLWKCESFDFEDWVNYWLGYGSGDVPLDEAFDYFKAKVIRYVGMRRWVTTDLEEVDRVTSRGVVVGE